MTVGHYKICTDLRVLAMFRLLFACLCLLASVVSAADQLDKTTYEKWKTYIMPSERELAYRKIHWRPSLGPAITEAREKNKPILLWNYNGHSLGCACNNGVITKNLFGDNDLQELCKNFVPVAEDAFRLQVEKNYPGHDFFKQAYSPANQGIYVLTPSGKLLGKAEWKSYSDYGINELLIRSMNTWDELKDKEKTIKAKSGSGTRPELKMYPNNGLVLHVYSRDLPKSGSYSTDWNQDFAWFQKNEAKLFLPRMIKEGQQTDVPQFILHRLARFHLVDNVHGESRSYKENAVKTAQMTSKIISIKQNIIELELSGRIQTEEHGNWSVDHDKDIRPRSRGQDSQILGKAKYNTSQQKFSSFELVVYATRFGGTEYNFRINDLDAAPIGMVLILDFEDKIKPRHFSEYGWSKQ